MARSDGSVIIDTRLNTGGFGKGVNNLKSQFTKMGAAASKVGGTITSVFTRGTKSAKGFNSQLNAVGAMARKVGGLIAAAFSIRAIVNFGKEALELGSDLQEVQNVVDVTFTTMNERINEFAKNAASTAGLSETMAKRYAGTFGAMAKSFRFTEEEAFNMSTALTQLAGDVASFYNITQDEAYTKLKSVFTGETETLKDLGVVMTQTALDDYALRKGLGKTTSQMSEQEKVALRYQFVLDQLSAASGDFIRTQDGWANQTRILSLQFEQLKATIGQGLINALTPAIKSLNLLIARFQEAAESFRDLTETIFGSAGDVSGAIGGITDSTEDMGDAVEEAGKQAKKALAPFDEIVKIGVDAEETEPAVTIPGADNETPGASVTPDVDVGDVGQTIIDQIAESIKSGDWASIGTLINNGITTALNGINWDDAKAKVAEGAQKVAEALNGLTISPDAFASIGTGFGESLNVLATALQTFTGTINWDDLSEGISAGLMAAAESFNAGAAVDALTQAVSSAYSAINFSDVGMAIAAALNDATANADWTKVGNTIGQVLLAVPSMVVGFAKETNWENIGKALSEALVGLIDEATAFIEDTDWLELGKNILRLINGVQWADIGVAFAELLRTVFSGVNFSGISELFQSGLWTSVKNGFDDFVNSISDGIQKIDFSQITQNFSVVANGLAGIAESAFAQVGPVVESQVGLWGQIIGEFGAVFGQTIEAISGGFAKFFEEESANISGWIAENAPKISSGFDNLNFSAEKIFGTLWSALDDNEIEIENSISDVLSAFTTAGTTIGTIAADIWSSITSGTAQFLEDNETDVEDACDNVIKNVTGMANSVSTVINDLFADIQSWWGADGKPIFDALVGALQDVGSWCLRVWNEVLSPVISYAKTEFDKLWQNSLRPLYQNLLSFFTQFGATFNAIWAKVKPVADWLITVFGPPVKESLKGIVNAFSNLGKTAADIFSAILDGGKGILKFLEGTFTGDWEKAWEGLAEAVKSPVNAIIGLLNGMVNGIVTGVNTVINAANSISFELPDWIPKVGGQKFGISIPTIKAPQIPYLAQGAVIPPNAPFMAVLGDQRHGTNIEAPLETIEQALENVLARRGSGMNDSQVIELLQAILEAILGIEIDGETLTNAMNNYQRKMAVSTGGNA